MTRRQRLPDLSRVLDSGPQRGTPAVPIIAIEGRPREQRLHTRFDKIFLVLVGSELYGDCYAIARNVSAGGILVEMTYAPPLGTVVTVHFQHVRAEEKTDEMVVRAEVKHHHYLNFSGDGEAASTRAIGLRFIEFVDAGDRIDPACVH